MEKNNLINKLKQEYDDINVNKKGIDIMKKSIENAKREKTVTRRWLGISVAAAFGVLVVMPNISPTVAMAMSKIPVISGIVDIVTLNKYSDIDKNLDVKLPVAQGDSDSLNKFNQTTEQYVKDLVQKFESEFNSGDSKSLDISYNVVADTNDIFSLKINGLETAASGYQYSKVYNLDKNTGEIIELKDIFKENSNYVEVLSENIKNQMRKAMKEDENVSYFIDKEDDELDTNFEEIKADQNFYIDNENNIVILFDEYEVAPGFMGAVEFTINKNDVKDILK